MTAPSSTRPDVPAMTEGAGWNDLPAFKVINTTTSKLADELGELAFHNERVYNSDAEPEEMTTDQFLSVPMPAYNHVLQVTHTGGRDWTIIVGLEYVEVEPTTQGV